MSKCFAAVSDGSKAFCITGKTGGNCLTEKTERTRIGAVLIFALAARGADCAICGQYSLQTNPSMRCITDNGVL